MASTAPVAQLHVPIFVILDDQNRVIAFSRNPKFTKGLQLKQLPDPLHVYKGEKHVLLAFRHDIRQMCYPPASRVFLNTATKTAIWIVADLREVPFFRHTETKMVRLSMKQTTCIGLGYESPRKVIWNWSFREPTFYNGFLYFHTGVHFPEDVSCAACTRRPDAYLRKIEVPESIWRSGEEQLQYNRGFKLEIEHSMATWEIVAKEALGFAKELMDLLREYVVLRRSGMWLDHPEMREKLLLEPRYIKKTVSFETAVVVVVALFALLPFLFFHMFD
jgi:hypothetical protein